MDLIEGENGQCTGDWEGGGGNRVRRRNGFQTQ
jgi:hypothetical protein